MSYAIFAQFWHSLIKTAMLPVSEQVDIAGGFSS
jgi:hypothetical protein